MPCATATSTPITSSSRPRPIILDWMTAVRGCPAGDVSRTLLLLSIGEPAYGMSPDLAVTLNLVRKILVRSYLKEYRRLTHTAQAEIDAWKFVTTAARFAEQIPGERKNSCAFWISAKLSVLGGKHFLRPRFRSSQQNHPDDRQGKTNQGGGQPPLTIGDGLFKQRYAEQNAHSEVGGIVSCHCRRQEPGLERRLLESEACQRRDDKRIGRPGC